LSNKGRTMEGRKPPSTVRGVMSQPVVTAKPDDSIREAAELMSRKGVGSIVVVHKGKPIGIVTERDMLMKVVAKGIDPSQIKVEEVMSKPLTIIKDDMPIIEAIRTMQKKKIRRLLITESEALVGIVTQRDLLRALAFHVIISFRPLLEMG